jgi:hypothetical protein
VNARKDAEKEAYKVALKPLQFTVRKIGPILIGCVVQVAGESIVHW